MNESAGHSLLHQVGDTGLDVSGLHDALLDDLLHVREELIHGTGLQSHGNLICAASQNIGWFHRDGTLGVQGRNQLRRSVLDLTGRTGIAGRHLASNPNLGLEDALFARLEHSGDQLAALEGIDVFQDGADLPIADAGAANLQDERTFLALLGLILPNGNPVEFGLPTHPLIVVPVGLGVEQLCVAAGDGRLIHVFGHDRIGRSSLENRLLGIGRHIAHQGAIQENLDGVGIGGVGRLTLELHHGASG